MQAETNSLKVVNVTADTSAIVTGPGYYFGCRVTSDATNAGRVVIQDNLTSGGGTTIDDIKVPASSAQSQGAMFPFGVRFSAGLSVDVTTVTSVTIWYLPTGA